MSLSELYVKGLRKVKSEVVQMTRDKPYYPAFYRSFWHYRLTPKRTSVTPSGNYFTAVPNVGAGIGHQLANWIAGYWYSKQLDLNFAHTPFSTESWEKFFGFGEDEVLAQDLLTKGGYRRVRLPLFGEKKPEQLALIRSIISSYRGSKFLFVAEQDQPYRDQFGVIDDIRRKFNAAQSRKEDRLIYSEDHLNVAVHVRRGDIGSGSEINPKWQHRWQGNEYFATALSQVLTGLETHRQVAVYIFSQGDRQEFAEFERFPGVNYCLDMGARESFLHMARADILITSKSSFSYKPALLNDGVKICPQQFWHGYPDSPDWILAGEDGSVNQKLLSEACAVISGRS